MRCLVLLVSIGCSELPIIERNVCGNLVIEPGELCDGFSMHGEETRCGDPSGPHPCAFVCDAEIRCPPGWSCGRDARCRLPDREFESLEEVRSFRSIDATMGDVDGDGFADLIGNDRSRFHVLFQTSPRAFDQDFLLETRLPIGAPFIGDLDGDPRSDVVIPTLNGLLMLLGQDDRTLLSRIYDLPIELASLDSFRVVIASDRHEMIDPAEIAVVIGDSIGSIDDAGSDFIALPTWLDGMALPPRIPSGAIPSNDSRRSFALWNEGGNQVAIYRLEGSAGAQRPELRFTISAPAPLGSIAALVDVDADGELDVAASTLAAAEPVAIALAETATTAAFVPFCNLRFEIFNGFTGQWLPVDAPLRHLADFDGDGATDYVFDLGVLTTGGVAPRCGMPVRTTHLSAIAIGDRWLEAESGDFNGDGRVDFAAASNQRQLDVYFGSGTGGFNRRTVLLEQVPHRIRAGDFDGDFIDDLAFVFEEPTGDLVSVIFGDAASELSDPRAIGRFAHVLDAITAQWTFDAESLDLVSDLVIQSRGNEAEQSAVAIAFGSTSRQMFAPLSFPGSETGPPIVVTVGDYCACEGAGCVERKDLFAVSRTLMPERTQMWVARGVAEDPPGRLIPGAPVDFTDDAGFEFVCSVWTTANLDDDPEDEILGVDHVALCPAPQPGPSRLLGFDLNDCAEPSSTFVPSIGPEGLTGVTRLRAKDLDADGDVDLLLVFAGDDGAGLGVSIRWNDRADFNRITMVEVPAGQTPIDVAAIQLDADLPLELVLRTVANELDRSSLFFVDADESANYGSPEIFRNFDFAIAGMAAGDLDGDGLDDLAVALGSEVRFIWGKDGAR